MYLLSGNCHDSLLPDKVNQCQTTDFDISCYLTERPISASNFRDSEDYDSFLNFTCIIFKHKVIYINGMVVAFKVHPCARKVKVGQKWNSYAEMFKFLKFLLIVNAWSDGFVQEQHNRDLIIGFCCFSLSTCHFGGRAKIELESELFILVGLHVFLSQVSRSSHCVV